MPRRPQNSDTDGSDPWGHDLLQSGLKKSAPSKFLEKRAAQQVVAKHPCKQPGQNSGMPVPVGRAAFRNECGKDDEICREDEKRADQQP